MITKEDIAEIDAKIKIVEKTKEEIRGKMMEEEEVLQGAYCKRRQMKEEYEKQEQSTPDDDGFVTIGYTGYNVMNDPYYKIAGTRIDHNDLCLIKSHDGETYEATASVDIKHDEHCKAWAVLSFAVIIDNRINILRYDPQEKWYKAKWK